MYIEKINQRVLFVGLGVMGYPMAYHLANHLNELAVKMNHISNNREFFVYNRSKEKAEKFVNQYMGQFNCLDLKVVQSFEEIDESEKFDLVILCVKDDDSVKEVLFGSDNETTLLSKINTNGVIIDHTSITAKTAIQMHQLAKENQIDFLDAPISGGQVGAEKGQLAIMVGGNQQCYSKLKSLIKCYGKNIVYMGDSGNGQLAKMCNQICLTGILQSLSESLIFAERAGLDIKKLISVISSGAAGSWQMDNRAHTMHKREFDFGFSVELMIKDLKNTLSQANDWDLELPVSEMIYGFYQELKDNGDSKSDTSSLIRRLK